MSLFKRLIFAFLIYNTLSSPFISASEIPQYVLDSITEARQMYCPDRRISVFDVQPVLSGDTLTLNGEVMLEAAKTFLIETLNAKTQHILIDNILTLPGPSAQQRPYGVICLSVAQLRRGPDVDQEMISQAIMGTEIKILKASGFFYFCQMEDGYLGWMMRSSFVDGDKTFIQQWRAKPKLIITTLHAQVYTKSSESSLPISDLVRGDKLIKLGASWKWYHVELPDGRRGYIRKKSAMDESEQKEKYPATADAIIETAFSVYGVPYFWGGKSTKGFDCSGFTQSTFSLHGIQLQRDANMQVKQGIEVSLEDNLKHLQPGDLLFFGRKPDRITHVGLYIGDSQFIHADGYVHTNSFNPEDDNFSEYRRQSLRAARRILQH